MIIKDKKLTFDDVTIVPALTSSIQHRSQCSPYCCSETLPIFTAPMGALINENNYQEFNKNGITSIIPRTVDWKTRIELLKKDVIVALSLDEANTLFLETDDFVSESDDCKYKICVDIANGHMQHMLAILNTIKYKWNDRVYIIAGNIANPKTYNLYCDCDIDAVRVGIGTGSRCTTSCLTAVHYPMASLIDEISKIKAERNLQNKHCTKIIADGGTKNYADIIKALALGADFVMVGKMFAECAEAAEQIYSYGAFSCDFPEEISKETLQYYINANIIPGGWFRKYYGMSTHHAQSLINAAAMSPNPNFQLKGEEGIVEEINVKYTLSQWKEGFLNALRSAMSYTNCKTIADFCSGKVNLVQISTGAFAHFDKKYNF